MSLRTTLDTAIETPDYLIGVGGGGSKIVEKFMQRDWILESKLNPEIGTSDGILHTRTVDSATGERERSQRQSAESTIQKDIDRLVEEFELEYTQVDYEHYNYVEDSPGSITENDLSANYNVNETLESDDRLGNAWWLNDDRSLIGDGQFGNGVSRRRALSKALYHISAQNGETGQKTHPANYNVSGDDQVAMVVALGGGTGSGSFIDIAKDFPPDADVHLFGILPDDGYGTGSTEPVDELGSAYAALSELEYMQVNDESPFNSIVLLPFNTAENSDHFEEAVIDTILSYTNCLEVDNTRLQLIPGGNPNAIGGYSSFLVAIPKIIEFDAGVKWDAQDNLETYIETRSDQLAKEERFYEVVEHYLKNNFESSIKLNLEPDDITNLKFNVEDEDQQTKILSMAQRLEDGLQGDLLSDDNIKVAGVPVEEIFEAIAEQYETLGFELEDVAQETPPYERVQRERDVEYALEFIEQVPDNIHDHLSADLVDGHPDEELLEIIRKEASNVTKRRELLRAIYATDSEKFEGVEPSQAKNIKRALSEVVMNSNAQSLVAEFRHNQITNTKNEIGRDLYRNEIHYAQLSEFKQEISDDYRDLIETWWEESTEEFETVVTYKQKRDEIQSLITGLNKACQKMESKLSDENVSSDALTRTLRNVDGEEVDTGTLNELLADLGVGECVNRDTIEDHVDLLIQAKSAKENYGGRLPWRNDEDEQLKFENAVADIRDSPYFEISHNDIERTFSVQFTHNFEYLLDLVDDAYEDAIEAIEMNLRENLVTISGGVKRHSVKDLVNRESVLERLIEDATMTDPERFIDEFGVHDLTVPESAKETKDYIDSVGATLSELNDDDVDTEITKGAIKRQLHVDSIVDHIGPFDSDGLDPSESDLHAVLNEFVQPIENELAELQSNLEVLGSQILDSQNEGAFQALQRLIRLANNKNGQPSDEGIDLMKPPTLAYDALLYGPDFYEEYEDNFELPATSRDTTREDSLFKTYKEAETRDLVDDPADISESKIWDHQSETIVANFKSSMLDAQSRENSRNPVDLSGLGPRESRADEVGDQYEELRMVQTYMSRVFTEAESGSEAGFSEVRDLINRDPLNQVIHEKSGYCASRIPYGDEWTITMTTFVSAFTLGMLEPVEETYKAVYTDEAASTDYPWRNHVLGVDGNWDSWETLNKYVQHDLPEWYPYGGAYLWRSETTPDEICEHVIKAESNDWEDFSEEDVVERINSLFTIEGFESLVEIQE